MAKPKRVKLKLLIDTSQRNFRRLDLSDLEGEVMESVEGDAEVLVLLDRLLKKAKVDLSQITQVEAQLAGESQTGILIGAAAANVNFSGAGP